MTCKTPLLLAALLALAACKPAQEPTPASSQPPAQAPTPAAPAPVEDTPAERVTAHAACSIVHSRSTRSRASRT